MQQLAFDAVQELRIKYRWDALDQQNKAIEAAKAKNEAYRPEILYNGDIEKTVARKKLLSNASRYGITL